MVVLVWFDGGKGEPKCHLQGVTSTEVMAASLELRYLAVEIAERRREGQPPLPGRQEGGAVALGGGEAAVEADDVVIEVHWYSGDPQAEPEVGWQRCCAPTAGQAWAASALLEEVARHQYRMRLTAEQAEQIARDQAARQAIERAAGRTDLSRLGKA